MAKLTDSLQPFWRELKRGNVSAILSRYSDMLLPVGVLLAIGTLFVPLPPAVISVLIVVNLAVSIIVLATSLYISSPTQLTSYPTILLLTTVFRLTLSVSATRSILRNGTAGGVIEALGEITAQGSIIVGAVMFITILVVQFIVVAKGSERVAEVAARFTLDAMPGKQMSIDADMRSGLITQDQARAARSSLQKESQLYGAMDGAMKFVKGDAIATIVIALVNIAGGLAVGTLVKGMPFAAAAQKYTIMTIGDGLAAIISSMLITVSAGIVVTRVSSEEDETNVGADISQQLLRNPKPLMMGAGLLLVMAVLPGMPLLPLLAVGGIVGGVGYSLMRAQKKAQAEEAELRAKTGAVEGKDELQPTFAVPLAVVVSPELTRLIDSNTPTGTRFRAELPKLRSAVYYDLGVLLPSCYVSGDAPLKSNQYFIAIKEVPVVYGSIRPDCVYVNDSADNIRVFGLEGEDVRNPADLKPGAWIPMSQRHIAELAGLKVWEPAEVITLHLSMVMKKYAHEFIGIQESQALLDFAARGAPKLVEEVVPKVVTIHQFTDVLQRLVQEGISIRDVKSILDALSEWGRVEKNDPVVLTEYVRSSMKRYISFRYTGGRDTLFVYLLDPEIEDVIRGAIRRTSAGSFLSLDPSIAHDILDAMRREIGNLPPGAQKPVVITDMELRRFVRKMVELEFPTLTVLSYQELAPELNVQPVGRITMRPPQAAANFFPDEATTAAGGALPSVAATKAL
ncbi:MAG TPA: type III secretion system export apparatus subunit SctV [Pyrinomonadaceae bacterium]|nr:type III secretion system export apparatus subunit SctV [Pyrinomonadaceae bacterium]